jgi:hypothetical protein
MPERPGKIIDASHAFMDAAPLGTRLYSAEQMRAYVRADRAAREGEPKRTFDCSWPHCGCDRTGVDSPPCRAEHANERAAAPAAREGEPVYGIFDPDYARVFTKARCIAWSEGYALAVHGSFTRDLDLLAVPWADHACDAEHLVDRIADACGLKPNGHPPGDKPHGRRAWTLLFPEFGDPRFIDLSVFAAPPALPQDADIDVECETCDGRGTIDERLGGYGDSNPAAKCPDCDGAGWWRRRTDPPALHETHDPAHSSETDTAKATHGPSAERPPNKREDAADSVAAGRGDALHEAALRAAIREGK